MNTQNQHLTLAPRSHLDHTRPVDQPELRVRELGNGLPPLTEEVLIGALLQHEEAFAVASNQCTVEDFTSPVHQMIWRACEAVQGQGKKISILSVWDELKLSGLTESVPYGYVLMLSRFAAPSSMVEPYALRVSDNALSRRFMLAATRIIDLAQAPGDAQTRVGQAQAELLAIEQTNSRSRGMHALVDVLPNVEKMMAEADRNGMIGISSGFPQWDKMTGGLCPGDLIVIGGRPSMGKTAFALDVAGHVSGMSEASADAAPANGRPVLMLSLEMSTEKLLMRTISKYSRIHQAHLRSGTKCLSDVNSSARYLESVNKIGASQFYVDDRKGRTLSQVIGSIMQAHARLGGLGLVVIDYMTLIRRDDMHLRMEDTAFISEVSGALKMTAGRLQCPIILLSQLNRSLESRADKRPQMSDLRGSGGIEQDADVIGFLFRENKYNPAIHESQGILINAKCRDGMTGDIPLFWDGATVSYRTANASLPQRQSSSWAPRPAATGLDSFEEENAPADYREAHEEYNENF